METTKTIYVGGFSKGTNASHLYTAFQPFGEILDLQLPTDPASTTTNGNKGPKNHRGFAFITYSNQLEALDAVDNMHRNVLSGVQNLGKVLKVNISLQPKGVSKSSGNRAIWTDEAWIAENGTAAPDTFAVGTEGTT